MNTFLLWLKKYWKWIALGVGIIAVAIYLRQDFINDKALNTLLDNMEQTSEAHLKEIERLEKINKQKEKQLKELNEEYKKKIAELKKEYESNLKNIKVNIEEKRERIIVEAYRDPNTLTERVEKVFGIPYYEPGENE